jgi:ubiquinol-cytochrome c reductase iron-sulfur subunit
MDGTPGVTMPPRPLLVALAVAAIVVTAGVIAAVVAGDARPAVIGVALGGVATGIGFVATGRGGDHEQPHESRTVAGPRLGRRATIAAAASVTVAVGIASVPAARRLDDATRRLRSTRWTAGTPLVDSTGTRIALRSVEIGTLVNVYPQGWVGEADSQAILLREDPARFATAAQGAPGPTAGLVAYSKLCTHMACPLGLYEQQSGTLLCPCHQAQFDVLAEGRVLRGPADRALPMLPLAVDDDGLLIAEGDFTDAVGTGFWGRP